MQPATLDEITGRLESAHLTLAHRSSGIIAASRNGLPLFEFSLDPPHVTWEDPRLEEFLRVVLAYEPATRALQQNRGRDTFMLRATLREQLNLEVLLDAARAAHVRVREEKHFTSKELYFWHAAYGEFVQATCLRGQSHVVDITFSARDLYLAVRYSLDTTDVCRKTAASSSSTRPVAPAFDQPAADLREEGRPVLRLAEPGVHTLVRCAMHSDETLFIRRAPDGSNTYWVLGENRLFGPLTVTEFPHKGQWTDIAEKRWMRLDVEPAGYVRAVGLTERPTDGWYAVN